MTVMAYVYKCQPCPAIGSLRRGFLPHRGTDQDGDDPVDFATRETSSGRADFLGRALPNTDDTHCAAPDCAAACSQWSGPAA